MKRAWPYALALAVVVTGCYLALAPLLRSLSPAPTTSANRLSQTKNVTTVGKSKTIHYTGADPGTTSLVSSLHIKKKAAKKVSKPPVKAPATPKVTTSPQSSTTSGVANTPPASSSNTAPKTTKTTSSSTTKTANRKNTPVGGQVDQSQSDGFAGPTGSGTVTSGQTLAPGN
jgi:hypothetical protein